MKFIFTLFFSFLGTMSVAQDLPEPQGPVLLTISGDISVTNGSDVARFDRAMLEALPQRVTTTKTPWFEGPKDFAGPLGQALLDRVGARGSNLQIIALNDYAATVPAQDFADEPIVFATHVDGEELTVREKGPLFLIYPFDENPDLYNEVYFGRSVWQIDRIEVTD